MSYKLFPGVSEALSAELAAAQEAFFDGMPIAEREHLKNWMGSGFHDVFAFREPEFDFRFKSWGDSLERGEYLYDNMQAVLAKAPRTDREYVVAQAHGAAEFQALVQPLDRMIAGEVAEVEYTHRVPFASSARLATMILFAKGDARMVKSPAIFTIPECIVRVKVPKGTPLADLTHLGSGEGEWLLPANCRVRLTAWGQTWLPVADKNAYVFDGDLKPPE